MRFQVLSRPQIAEIDFAAKLPYMWISPGAVTAVHLIARRAHGRGFGRPLVSEEVSTSTRRSRRRRSFELEAGCSYQFVVWVGSHAERFDVASLAPGRYGILVSVPSYFGAYAKPHGVVEVCLRGPGFDDLRRLETRWWRLVEQRE
jgi:hypothetical protein